MSCIELVSTSTTAGTWSALFPYAPSTMNCCGCVNKVWLRRWIINIFHIKRAVYLKLHISCCNYHVMAFAILPAACGDIWCGCMVAVTSSSVLAGRQARTTATEVRQRSNWPRIWKLGILKFGGNLRMKLQMSIFQYINGFKLYLFYYYFI